MYVAYPFHLDARGRTAEASEEEHVRQLIEQVLFTSPGERVNRPTFGADVLRLVFTGNSDPVAAAAQFMIKGALQQWLGDRIEVLDVGVDNPDSSLVVTVRYRLLRSDEQIVTQFRRGV